MEADADERLEAILYQAVAIESAERRAQFLDEACAGDACLRANVDKLIHNHFAAGSFLQHPAVSPARIFGENVGAPDDSTEATVSAEDIPLNFLEPAEQPGSLGWLGRYEILEVVGRGGMGIVLKARDTNLQRIVAVKVLAPELAANATARKRFLREARAAAAVSHNHIVTIYAVEENGGVANGDPSKLGNLPFLVMEFIDGQSLQERIDQHGPLELKEILRIGRQIASGLAAAHRQGLIHRDIKPANILLENGVHRVQITDFGLARAVDDVGMTRTGEVAGTPVYMSPEQAMGQPIDLRSDLFSLGSVLYAMCTGRAPFRAETTVAVLRRVCDDTPRPIREVTPEIPEWLAALINRLLEKNPDHRFQSATEVADLLRKHLAHVQAPGSSPLPDTILSQEYPAKSRGRQKAWVIAAAVLLVLAAGLGLAEATGTTHLVSTVIRILTPEGTLVVEIDDPGVKVTVEGDGRLVITGAGLEEIRLRPGSYRIHADKDGRPIPLDKDLVTVTRGGRAIVNVKLETSPPLTSAKAEKGAFVVLGGSGVAEHKFDTLAEAVISASDGDTIEIRGNGPFVTDRIDVRYPLTMRAGAGFRPVIIDSPRASEADHDVLISAHAPLRLEGLDFRCPRSRVIVNADERLAAANCRFLNTCIQAANAQLRNCEVLGPRGANISVGCASDSEVVVGNCLLVGHINLTEFDERGGPNLTFTHNSLISPHNNVFLHLMLRSKPSRTDTAEKVLHLNATHNVIEGVGGVYQFIQVDEFKPHLTVPEVEAWLRSRVVWREENNRYHLNRPWMWIRVDDETRPATLGSLAEWNQFWSVKGTGSTEGVIRFNGGDLVARGLGNPEELSPDDFRLRPDSAGYRAGPDGKDLGADVDLVGPGAAYERWKKTPEYQQWLKDTGQAK